MHALLCSLCHAPCATIMVMELVDLTLQAARCVTPAVLPLPCHGAMVCSTLPGWPGTHLHLLHQPLVVHPVLLLVELLHSGLLRRQHLVLLQHVTQQHLAVQRLHAVCLLKQELLGALDLLLALGSAQRRLLAVSLQQSSSRRWR
jgi:hypothetical protein